MCKKILFQEIKRQTDSWSHIIQEARESGDLQGSIPTAIQDEIRTEQLDKLQRNIDNLRQKQKKFNNYINNYIHSLQELIQSIASQPPPEEGAAGACTSLFIRCLGCGREQTFQGYSVIKAIEPDKLEAPTEFWLYTPQGLKRGTFNCPECGPSHLSIKCI